ncbi:MAG TPA: winged helix-turn-helix domain-containing protein [Pelagibacteraceae bacterium]|jgi:DNA-binding response OmpR family regulator|nr:winged helix-turn-helix domain-containing protein [Pelagibacteraceae bacterium]
MQNITLHVVGQRVLADILKEKEGIIKMNILFFENLSDFLENTKNNIVKSIVVTHLSNLELIRQSNSKIDNPIFFLTSNKNNISTKTKLQKYELIYCPFNLINFIEKINLAYSKYNFVINSKVELSNYIINLNTREIIANQNKLKLTEREKDFLLFLNNSKKPQTIRNILEAVWGYSKDIETHTVETHVHRLRKKFFSTFNDSNFIKNNKKGYYI